MANVLPSALVIFTIVGFACAVSVYEDNAHPKKDGSPKDSAEIASLASSKNPASGRIIRPSAWSKQEEGELKQSEVKNTGNEEQDSMIDDKDSMLNIKKFFRYFMSFLYAVDEGNDESLKKATSNMILKLKHITNRDSLSKSERNENDEMQNFEESDSVKSADKRQFQSSSSANTSNKSSGSRKDQTLSNEQSLNNKKTQETPKFESQNSRDNQDDKGMQNYPFNNALNKNSNEESTQKSSHKGSSNSKKPKGETKQETRDSVNKDSANNNMKTEAENLEDNNTEDNTEIQNSPTDSASNKGSSDSGGNVQNASDNDSVKKNQSTGNPKKELKNSNNKDSMNKSKNNIENELPKLENSDTQGKEEISPASNDSDKLSNNGSAKKSDDSSNNKQPAVSPEQKTQNSNSKDFTDKSQNNVNNETTNLGNTDTQNNKKIQDSLKHDTSDKPSNVRNPKSSNDYSSKNNLPTTNPKAETQDSNNENSKDNSENNKNLEKHQQNPIYEDNLSKTTVDTNNQNPLNKENQTESISASKGDKPKEDLTKIPFKDDECKSDELRFDDSLEGNAKEYQDNYREEDEYENDTDESDVDETEAENVYNGLDDNENDVRKNNVEDGDENYADVNNGNGNNYEDKEDKTNIENQNSQPAVNVQEKKGDKPITLPKFIIQEIPDQQNNSKTDTSRNQVNNNDNIKSVKSPGTTIEENLLRELQQNKDEFVDDYINNRQSQNPQNGNEQGKNIKPLNTNGKDEANKNNSLGSSINLNNPEKDYMSLNVVPPVSESMQKQNIPFHQSENAKDNNRSQKNTISFPIFDEDRKGSSLNQGPLDATFPEHLSYLSVDKPIFDTQENKNNVEVTRQKLFPFQQRIYNNNNFQDTFTAPQNDYNTFAQPAISGFQDNIPPVNEFYTDVLATNEYRPEITSSFERFPSNPIPFQNGDYLKNQYKNYNFQNEKNPDLYNVNNKHFEQDHPTLFQPSIFSNTQYFSNQDAPNELDKTTNFKNSEPGRSYNTPYVETPRREAGMLSNRMISDVLYPELPFNQDSSPTGFENDIYQKPPEDHRTEIKSQNTDSEKQKLNPQNQADNQRFQDNFPVKQMLFLQRDKSSHPNQINNTVLPDKIKMNSNNPSAQDKIENTEFQPRENSIINESKEVPQLTLNATDDKLQIKPKSQDSAPVNREYTTQKSRLQQTKEKSNKPLTDERQKNPTFDQSEGQEKVALSSDSDSNKTKDEDNNVREYNYDNEDNTNDDEDSYVSENNYDDGDNTNEDEDQEDENENKDDYVSENNSADEDHENVYEDEDEIDDDFLNERNYDNKDNGNTFENEYEDEYEIENEFRNVNSIENEDTNEDKDEDEEIENNDEDEDNDDRTKNENYLQDKNIITNTSQNPQKDSTTNKNIHGNRTIAPKYRNKINTNQKSHSEDHPPPSQINYDDMISEPSDSLMVKNKEIPPAKFKLNNDEFDKKHNNNTIIKENKPATLLGGTANDASKQTIEEHGDKTKMPETSDSESASSDKGGNYNTILEYLYKFSNNSLFKGVKEENS